MVDDGLAGGKFGNLAMWRWIVFVALRQHVLHHVSYTT